MKTFVIQTLYNYNLLCYVKLMLNITTANSQSDNHLKRFTDY